MPELADCGYQEGEGGIEKNRLKNPHFGISKLMKKIETKESTV